MPPRKPQRKTPKKAGLIAWLRDVDAEVAASRARLQGAIKRQRAAPDSRHKRRKSGSIPTVLDGACASDCPVCKPVARERELLGEWLLLQKLGRLDIVAAEVQHASRSGSAGGKASQHRAERTRRLVSEALRSLPRGSPRNTASRVQQKLERIGEKISTRTVRDHLKKIGNR